MKSVPLEVLAGLATNRPQDLFRPDVGLRRGDLSRAIAGRRLLVIGGAGSIGSATIGAIAEFRPAALHVVDQNENGLAELVRTLRSQPAGLPIADFRTFPIDFGSAVMHRLIESSPPYDAILNFAALKHVRTEKDAISLLQMLDTNVVKAARLLTWLQAAGYRGRYFSVSTDKAANPVNLMGASKRLMEHVALSGDFTGPEFAAVTSARFANVAFSDGSLLYGFLQRLQKGQAMAVPRGVRRFFVSMAEAGQICMLAAFCAGDRDIVIPRLDPGSDLRDLQEVAERVLVAHGLVPKHYESEEEARANVDADRAAGFYPLLLTSLDTSGEKPYEEFVGSDEVAVEMGLPNLLGVRYEALAPGEVARSVGRIERMIGDLTVPVDKETIVGELAALLPQFRHIETGRSLDGRM